MYTYLEENVEIFGIIRVKSFCESNEIRGKTGNRLSCVNTSNSQEIVNKDQSFHDFL